MPPGGGAFSCKYHAPAETQHRVYTGRSIPNNYLLCCRNLPIGGVVILLIGFVVRFPNTEVSNSNLSVTQKIAQLDIFGFLIFTLANVLFLLGLQWGGAGYAWNSSVVIGLLCGGIAAFLLFAVWLVKRGEFALIPLRLLRGRIIVSINLTTFIQSGATFIALYWMPLWFQVIKQASSFESGVWVLPMTISQLLAAVVCGSLVQRTGYYLPEIIFGNMLMAVGAGLFSTMSPTTTTGQWIGYQILVGTARGFVLQLVRVPNNKPRMSL